MTGLNLDIMRPWSCKMYQNGALVILHADPKVGVDFLSFVSGGCDLFIYYNLKCLLFESFPLKVFFSRK